jgi:hypothetical protein
MKIVKVSAKARTVNALLKQAIRENLVLQSEDGREFILAEIDDFDREIELTRRNKELMRLLDRRGREKAMISLEEAKARLGIG